MTKFPANNDDALFDRLVDGELSTAERQQLLASLDDRAVWGDNNSWDSGWRRCALAFLEAQAWGQQFKSLVAETTDEQTAALTLPPASSSKTRTSWFAVAASLLLAFSFGWLIKTPFATIEPKSEIAVIQRQEMPLDDEMPAARSEDAVTLLVRDASGKNQRLQVPLMEMRDLDDDFVKQFGAALPAKLRDSFRDRGFDLQRRRRFAPMFFEQNEQLVPMVVPVDDTYIVPVSRPIY